MADGSEVIATSFLARMTIADLEFDSLVEVYGVPMSQPSSRVLLGRSFLRRYIVTYNGLEERFYYERSQPMLHGGYEDFDCPDNWRPATLLRQRQIPAPASSVLNAASCASASAFTQAVKARTCFSRPFALGWTRW